MSRIDTKKEQLREVIALNNNFPFGMFVASVVLLTAGAVDCSGDCDGDGEQFAVIAGVVLTFFELIYIYYIYHGLLSERWDTIFAVAFFIGWAITAGQTTFDAPFDIPGNGFLAAWLGFISSTGNLVYNVRFADALKERFVGQGLYLCLLMVGSIVVLIAAVASDDCCDGPDILAIVAGAVSFTMVIVRVFAGPSFDRMFGVFLSVWWLSLGLILTFGEFEEIGNGYIATWVCIFASIGLLSQATARANPQFSARFSAKYQNYGGGAAQTSKPNQPPPGAYPTATATPYTANEEAAVGKVDDEDF